MKRQPMKITENIGIITKKASLIFFFKIFQTKNNWLQWQKYTGFEKKKNYHYHIIFLKNVKNYRNYNVL